MGFDVVCLNSPWMLRASAAMAMAAAFLAARVSKERTNMRVRKWIMRQPFGVYALLIGALILISTNPAAAAGDFCGGIADYIREASDTSAQGRSDSLIDQLAVRPSGYIRLSQENAENADTTLKRLHATPEFMAAVKAGFGDEFSAQFPGATVVWLQDDVGAVQALFGHTGCTVMVFFDASGAHVHEVPPPSGLSFGVTDLCGTPTWIAKINAVPAVIEEEDSADLTEARITVVPWQNRKWGKTCHISATFSAALLKNYGRRDALCHTGADCPNLYNRMHDFAESHLNDIKDERRELSEPLQRMVSETPNISEVPTFGKAKRGVKFEHKNLYDLSFDGRPYVAVIGWDSSWSYGIMAALWQPSNNGLAPVAGFEFVWARGKIKSLKVDVAE
jgi:hypothetical protein